MNDSARRPWMFALVAALLALHYALAVGSKLNESTTDRKSTRLNSSH